MLLQPLNKDAWAYVEYAGKMLDAAAFIKAAAADEFAFLGFGEEDVLRETVGFKFENFFRTGRVHFRNFCLLREGAELQARGVLRVQEQMPDGMEQRFQKFGIFHLSCRELDDGARASPVECANGRGCREERFYFDVFNAAVV